MPTIVSIASAKRENCSLEVIMSDHDPDKERTVAEYVEEYHVNRSTLNKAVRQVDKVSRLPARKLGSESGVTGGIYLIKQSDFDQWYAKHKPRKQKEQNGFSESQGIGPKTP